MDLLLVNVAEMLLKEKLKNRSDGQGTKKR